MERTFSKGSTAIITRGTRKGRLVTILDFAGWGKRMVEGTDLDGVRFVVTLSIRSLRKCNAPF